MTPKLGKELQRAVHTADACPLKVVDPTTESVYVLLTEEKYLRVRALVEAEPFDVSETYAAQDEMAARAGWDDPALDVYNDCEPREPQT